MNGITQFFRRLGLLVRLDKFLRSCRKAKRRSCATVSKRKPITSWLDLWDPEFNGKVAFEQTFDVGADRWRAWSTKGLDAHAKGEWKVTVVDGTGATLGTYTVTYGK